MTISTDKIQLINAGATSKFAVVEVSMLVDALAPEDLKPLKEKDILSLVDSRKGVILNGKMPLWLAGFLIHEYHATTWLAVNDPRLGAVVIASHTPGVAVGSVIDWKSELAVV